MKTILFIMPFGIKNEINFDEVYENIKKEIEKDDKYKAYRVDQMTNTSNIDKKMYKGIIAADIVVADLTLYNPNVLYELGIRHTLIKKTTKLIKAESFKENIPFDINHISVKDYTNNWNEMTKYILTPENESTDSSILSSIELPIGKLDEFNSVFQEWENVYNSFIDEYTVAEKSKNYSKIDEVLEKYEGKFNINFEPYVKRKVLATYKRNENDIELLLKAKALLSPMNISRDSSAEMIGLLCSINNRLLLNGLGEPSEIEGLTNIFLADKMTTYSAGVYVMSRVILGKKEYLKSGEIKDSVKRLEKNFSKIFHGERDSEYILDTLNLIKLVNEDIDISLFKNTTSKNNAQIIIDWKKKNHD